MWKAIRKLQEDGFAIEGVNNKGYKLAEDTDVLSVQGTAKYLDVECPVRLEVFRCINSTNLALRERTQEEEGLVLAAMEQTNGLGRLGRSFMSPANTGIYFSILLKPQIANQEVTPLRQSPLWQCAKQSRNTRTRNHRSNGSTISLSIRTRYAAS